MTKVQLFLYHLVFLICLCFYFSCNSPRVPITEPKTKFVADYAITNVSVLTMTSNRILKNQTVLVLDGKILAIGSNLVFSNATTIDGKGKFLMPGLTEMHAHIPVAKDGDDALVKETLFLYLSQGVTNIRGMLGNPYHLELKKQVANVEFLSPRIYTSSPSLNGNSIPTPEVAIEKITQYQKDGYDFLKIHPGIKLNVWDAVEKRAKEVGIPYAGHVPVEVGIRRALSAKYQTIDHLDGFLEGLVPTSANVDPSKNGFFGYDFTNLADETQIDALVDQTLANKVGIVATQTLFTRWFSPESPEKLGNEPEMKYMSPKTLFTWRQNKTKLINSDSYNPVQWEKFISIRKSLLKKMDNRGVTFLLGSDAPQVFNVPGFSIHHELADLSEAGISNYKILQAGTINPAIFFNAKGQYGTIEKGAAADLILTEKNPLTDVRNVQKIAGVMVGKNWLSKKNIDQRLKAIADKYMAQTEGN